MTLAALQRAIFHRISLNSGNLVNVVSHKTEPAAIISSKLHSLVVWSSLGGRNKGYDAVFGIVLLTYSEKVFGSQQKELRKVEKTPQWNLVRVAQEKFRKDGRKLSRIFPTLSR